MPFFFPLTLPGAKNYLEMSHCMHLTPSKEEKVDMKLLKPGSNTQTDSQIFRTLTVLTGDRHLIWSSDRKGRCQMKNTKEVTLACNELRGECLKYRLKFIVETVLKERSFKCGEKP